MNRIVLFPLLLVILIVSPGCISTYVGDPEKSTADPELVGVWHAKSKAGNDELWYVHGLDKRTYLVQLYTFPRTDGQPAKNDESATAHAWLTNVGGQRFISLKFFAPALLTDPKDPDANKRYIVARLVSTASGLRARGINPDFVKENAITSPADLEAAIAKRINDDAIYDDDTRDLARVDAANPGEIKPLLDLMK